MLFLKKITIFLLLSEKAKCSVELSEQHISIPFLAVFGIKIKLKLLLIGRNLNAQREEPDFSFMCAPHKKPGSRHKNPTVRKSYIFSGGRGAEPYTLAGAVGRRARYRE